MQKGIIKNVNKLTGEPIDAKDLASMLSGIIGNESGVLTVFDELRLEKISDNKVRLHSGVYSLKGHILYIPKGSYEDFEIESGTLGANRIDLLVAEYVKNGEGDGEDTLRFRVIKGKATSGTPQEPDLIQQDISENGIIAQEILYKLIVRNTELTHSKNHINLLNLSEISTKTKNTQDFVVKEESYAFGNFRMWQSGKIEVWSKFSEEVSISESVGAIYRSGIQYLAFPKQVKKANYFITNSANGNAFGSFIVDLKKGDFGQDLGLYFRVWHTYEIPKSNANINFYTVGSWK